MRFRGLSQREFQADHRIEKALLEARANGAADLADPFRRYVPERHRQDRAVPRHEIARRDGGIADVDLQRRGRVSRGSANEA